MPAISIRAKLISFFVGLLLAGQAIELIAVYSRTRDAIIEQAKQQLARADDIASQHIRVRAEQLTEGARIAFQDYSARTELVTGSPATRQSVLSNLAIRSKIHRALLIDLQGNIIADSALARDVLPPPTQFEFPSMLEASLDGDVTSAVVVTDGVLARIAILPLKFPVTAAYVAIQIPIDDAMAGELREESALPMDISFAFDDHGRGFRIVASTLPPGQREITAQELGNGLESRPAIIQIDGKQYVSIERTVPVAKESAYVTAVLHYAIDAALVPYQQLLVQLSVILLVVLALSLVLGLWMAETIARPVARLAAAARRIGAGDYSSKVKVGALDEVGQLGLAFNQMTAAIGEREERISHQADFDQLTDLPNRLKFERLLTQALAAEGDTVRPAAVALVGVNRLPEINNTLGHDLGDTLIKRIGPMISDRAPEGGLVGRVADSVFAVLAPGHSAEDMAAAARNIVHAFEVPVAIDENISVDAGVHIGIASSPQHGLDARTLLRSADVALFSARSGIGAIATYDPATDPYKPENLTMMGELRGGITRGELQLHYQPKIGLKQGKIIGAEALVRWIHPKHGFLPPDRFIPLAEESGTIHHLTNWALSSGINQARVWRAGGLDLRVAINLSVRDLLNRGLPDLVQGLLRDAGLSGETLILEITESAIMSDPEAAIGVLRKLADLGIHLSVDDFGTGHSSFGYLRKLPLAELKVDKSFVLNLAREPTDQAIVRTIVDLAHGLKLKVTAEGVEDQTAYDLLAGIGCDVGQGYFMSRPLTMDKFEAFARESAYAA